MFTRKSVSPLKASLLALSLALFGAAPAWTACTDGSSAFGGAVTLPNGGGTMVATGDFNGDSHLDLVSGGNDFLVLRLSTGPGTFASPVTITAGTDPSGVVAVDLTGDGILDLATANVHGNNVTILKGGGAGGVGNGTFTIIGTRSCGINPLSIVAADLNEDGLQDLVAGALGSTSVAVLLGTGGGAMAPAVFYPAGDGPAGLAIADLDGDGRLDILATDFNTNKLAVLRGNGAGSVGDGTFAAPQFFTVGNGALEIAVADLNGDGRPDCAVTAYNSGNVSVLLGQSNGSLGAATAYGVGSRARGVVLRDFDGDGLLDMAISAMGSAYVRLFLGISQVGVPTGTFDPGVTFNVPSEPTSLVAGDLNEDGKLDLAMATLNVNPSSNVFHLLFGQCGAGPPVIRAFTPSGGVPGDSVGISGVNFAGASAVRFNGVSTAFVTTGSTGIRTTVPSGAITGPITVTTPLGTTASSTSFLIAAAPTIDGATPLSGRIGDSILIHGTHFTNALAVRFGGTGSASFTVSSDTGIVAIVDPGATTGPIHVTNPSATAVSSFTFQVLPPDSAARIVSAKDIRADQGGFIMVAWRRSDLDVPAIHGITGYRVWRRAIGVTASSTRTSSESQTSRSLGLAIPGYWEPLVTLPAAFLDGYAYTVPTTQDSTALGNPYTAVFIQSLTSDPVVFYNSAVDSGYSVDNLAPAQPAPFVAVYGPASVALHWLPGREADLHSYRLHRGGSPGFVPTPSNLIYAGTDTGYVDFTTPPSGLVFKLAAIDVHGNVSRYALVTPSGPTSALASLVQASANPDRVRLVWMTSGNAGTQAAIYRRTPTEDWMMIARAYSDGTGLLEFEDDAVVAGGRYAYRLGILDGAEEVFAGEIWVDIPGLALALGGLRPNPAREDRLRVSLTLADSRPATLDIVDISGRQVRSREVGTLGPGRHLVDLSAGRPLETGIYLVRLRQGGQIRTVKAMIRR